MLVDRRDTLTVDDVIPVGDSFDYIVEGSEPWTCSGRAVQVRDRPVPGQAPAAALADNNLTESTMPTRSWCRPRFRAARPAREDAAAVGGRTECPR